MRPAVSFREFACSLRGSSLASASCGEGSPASLKLLDLTTSGNENCSAEPHKGWQILRQEFFHSVEMDLCIPRQRGHKQVSLLSMQKGLMLICPYNKNVALGIPVQVPDVSCPLTPAQPSIGEDVCHQDWRTLSG